MYEISFYEDKDGYSDICQFIKELREKSNENTKDRIGKGKAKTERL